MPPILHCTKLPLISVACYSAHSSGIQRSLHSHLLLILDMCSLLLPTPLLPATPPPPHRWTAGYFASIKFFEQKVEQAIKLVKGKDFDVKKDQGAVVFAQLVSGD
jgi:hypothetical protein